jgi:predicted nucleic acid-binding protein
VIIADTDVLIDYISGIQPVTNRIAAYIQAQQLQTTIISCFELLSGAEGKKGDRIRQFVAAMPILILDKEAAEQAAELCRELERKGEYIGMGDCLIAGIALTHNVPLITRNLKHFERVPNLKLIKLEHDQ